MLRQILSEMYIDPDLLAELSEEQKHILFFKMREEQVRRWKEREAAMEKKEPCPGKLRPRKDNGKSVKWKLGTDQEVWVWVMGEHQLDKPYDVICDEIIAERAQQQAQKEAEELRKAQGKELTNTSEVQSLHSDLSIVSHWETQNVAERAADEKKSGQVAKEAATVKEEKTQVFSSSPRSIHQMLADSINRSTMKGSQQKKVLMKKTQEEEMRRREEERTKQIYKSWKDAQDSVQKSDKEDPEWQESLRKSKAADEKRRSIAKQARDDYRRLSQAAQKGRGTEGSQSSHGGGQRPTRPPLPPKPTLPPPSLPNGRPCGRSQGIQRIPSCPTQEEIIKWFKEEQLPLRAGYEKTSDTIAPWFHGILTLNKTDELLKTGTPGSFLVRVSAKMKGYVLSYLSREGCKHFLIDASTDSYSFLGVDQLQHRTLADLVEYHKEEPITSLGKELLLHPCGQQGKTLDYLPLFE